jgi:hypothetical protein
MWTADGSTGAEYVPCAKADTFQSLSIDMDIPLCLVSMSAS